MPTLKVIKATKKITQRRDLSNRAAAYYQTEPVLKIITKRDKEILILHFPHYKLL